MTHFLLADRADIVLLDASRARLADLVDLLAAEFNVHPFSEASQLLDYLAHRRPVDLFLLDHHLAEQDGHALCRRLRQDVALDDVPIMLTGVEAGPGAAQATERSLELALDLSLDMSLSQTELCAGNGFAPGVLARVRHQVRASRAMRLVVCLNADLDRRVAERTAELTRRNGELNEAVRRLARLQDATLVALTDLAGLRDEETGLHVQRTREYVRALALALRRREPDLAPGLDDAMVDLLHKSAPLHDIGKVAIPDQILRKPGPLTPAEAELMKTHARIGHDALAAAGAAVPGDDGFLRLAREITLSHHERWDGRGYPQGLAGEAIPLSARLMALADVYDALVSQRAYKPGYPHEEAVARIRAESGRHFDPRVVEAFLDVADAFATIATTWSHEPACPPA